jgi:aspartate aminotransferase-like enzyme
MTAAPAPPAAAFGRFFLPGPTDVHPDVLAAMQRPMIGHRSSGMEALLQGVAPHLQALFRTSRPVLVGTASATGFMEMAVRNGVRRRALSLVNGAFSQRFAAMVGAAGKECIRLDVPLGAAIEPDTVRDALRRTPVDAVTVVHSETSTGVLQDIEGIARVVREFDDVLLLVDAVTSLAGSPVETDAWGGGGGGGGGLDFTFTGSQKALALPPGLALGVASQRMVERAGTLEGRGLYFDLVSFEQATLKFQPTNTPAISLLYALEAQLGRVAREGGVEARWRRHEAMRRRTEEWAGERGLTLLPRAGRRSWTVSCVNLPPGRAAKEVVAAVKREGWTIGSGYGALKDTTIRIGHMGDHTVAALDELLAVIARALA